MNYLDPRFSKAYLREQLNEAKKRTRGASNPWPLQPGPTFRWLREANSPGRIAFFAIGALMAAAAVRIV